MGIQNEQSRCEESPKECCLTIVIPVTCATSDTQQRKSKEYVRVQKERIQLGTVSW